MSNSGKQKLPGLKLWFQAVIGIILISIGSGLIFFIPLQGMGVFVTISLLVGMFLFMFYTQAGRRQLKMNGVYTPATSDYRPPAIENDQVVQNIGSYSLGGNGITSFEQSGVVSSYQYTIFQYTISDSGELPTSDTILIAKVAMPNLLPRLRIESTEFQPSGLKAWFSPGVGIEARETFGERQTFHESTALGNKFMLYTASDAIWSAKQILTPEFARVLAGSGEGCNVLMTSEGLYLCWQIPKNQQVDYSPYLTLVNALVTSIAHSLQE